MTKNWWTSKEPIYEFEDDGQGCRKIFTRKVFDKKNRPNGGEATHEYAIVTYTDDGYEIDHIVLRNGKVIDV
jgi:hypothetical protein